MSRKMYRVQHKFWLDVTKPDEDWLDETLHKLKQGRGFAKMIRDALFLILDLRAGNLDVLLSMFPFVREAVIEQYSAPKSPDTEVLRRIEQLLVQQGNIPIESTVAGPKKLMTPASSKPVADDAHEVLAVKKAKATGDSAKNFLVSAFDLVQ